MFVFLLVLHLIVAIALVTIILMQRSEGGGLTGASPSGLVSARGAADLMTRLTTIFATLFVLLSIALAVNAAMRSGPRKIDASLAKPAQTSPSTVPLPVGNSTDMNATANQSGPIDANSLGATPVPIGGGTQTNTATNTTAPKTVTKSEVNSTAEVKPQPKLVAPPKPASQEKEKAASASKPQTPARNANTTDGT